jgi:hypothetical protein
MGVAAALRPPRLSSFPRGVVLAAPLALLSAASVAGTMVAPALLGRSPLVLAILSPRSVFLLAAAARTPLPLFMAVGLVRLAAAGPSHYSIGQTWGRDISTRLKRGPLPARLAGIGTEWLFRRLGPLALVVSPTGKTVALASASEVPMVRIATWMTVGLVVRLTIFYAVAHR